MKPIGTPAMRLMPQSIIRSFQGSRKKHLLITGSRGSGKSTLAKELELLLCQTGTEQPFPGITTFAVPKQSVILEENVTGRRAVIGRYEEPKGWDGSRGGCMKPVREGLEGLGRDALLNCCLPKAPSGHKRGEWALVDELGYLESGCEPFCEAVRALFDRRRVLAVVRRQHTAFLDELRAREDVYLYDLDEPVLPVGCILMASGLGRRFGSNKLLARLEGKTLLEHALDKTGSMFARRVVVTRYPEIVTMCREQGIFCVLHELLGRNDTVRLGMEALESGDIEEAASGRGTKEEARTLAGYMFCPADQPLLTRETMESLVLDFSRAGRAEGIFRLSAKGKAGAPVLFGSVYREGLKSLPQGKGGSWLIRKYPENVHLVEADPWELWDVDTPMDLKACENRTSKTLD